MDNIQRNFEPLVQDVSRWQDTQITEATAKLLIYEAFIEGAMDVPKHLARPTHMNTPKARAMFEVCAQRWADIGDGGYGVALLNDSKHGYDIHGSTMRLSLLRALAGQNAASIWVHMLGNTKNANPMATSPTEPPARRPTVGPAKAATTKQATAMM